MLKIIGFREQLKIDMGLGFLVQGDKYLAQFQLQSYILLNCEMQNSK